MANPLREIVLREWRGLPAKLPRPDRCHSVGELLPKLMGKLGLSERLHEAEILAAWKTLVGDFIAANSAPSNLREGILYVQVLQPALHYELDRSRPEILRKLKTRFGPKVIRDLRFRVG